MMWQSRPPQAGTYRVQVARDAAFRDLIEDRVVSGAELSIPRPATGRYFARVSAEAPGGVAGPFSDAQAVQVPARFPYWLLPLLPLLFVL